MVLRFPNYRGGPLQRGRLIAALDGADVLAFISFDPEDQSGDTVEWFVNVPGAVQSDLASALDMGETLTVDYSVAIVDEEDDPALAMAMAMVSITFDSDGFLI